MSSNILRIFWELLDILKYLGRWAELRTYNCEVEGDEEHPKEALEGPGG